MTRCSARTGPAREARRVLLALRSGAFPRFEPGRFSGRARPAAGLAVEDERWELLEGIVSEVRRSLADPPEPNRGGRIDACVRLLEHLAGSRRVRSSGPSAARR